MQDNDQNFPDFLQYGEAHYYDGGTILYTGGDPVGETPIYYIVAGLVKLDIHCGRNEILPLYLTPDTIFGTVELISGTKRLTSARVI